MCLCRWITTKCGVSSRSTGCAASGVSQSSYCTRTTLRPCLYPPHHLARAGRCATVAAPSPRALQCRPALRAFRTMSPHAVLLSPTQRRLDAETSGFHRYAFVQHEQAVAAIAKEIGYDNVSLSSEVGAWLATIPTTWRSKVQQCGDGAQRVATGDADGQGRAARLHRDSRRVPDAAHT